jgi:hypothetical protein
LFLQSIIQLGCYVAAETYDFPDLVDIILFTSLNYKLLQ